LFTERSHQDQFLTSLPFSGVLRAPHTLCCMFLFSSLFIIQFCFVFFVGQGSVCPGGYAGLSRGRVCVWEYCMPFICSLVGLPNVSQAGLEPVSGSAGALLFSQCNVVWRSFVWPGTSGCGSFGSS
jgi:hypothetical protein